MADQIEGIDPEGPGEDLDLLLPYPHPGPIAMNQQKRFSFSFNNEENGVAFSLNSLRWEGWVPIDLVRSN